MNLETATIEEKDAFIKSIIENPYYIQYIALREQQDKLAIQLREADIQFGDDDKFDDFLKWTDKSKKLGEAIEFYRERLDPDALKRAEEEITKAKPTQLESRVKNRQS